MTQSGADKRVVPRMRTAAAIVRELKDLDPDTCVTESFVRQLAKEEAVPVVWSGNKALINLDDFLMYLRLGASRHEREPETVGGIRRVDVKGP